jgi:hypothetical protein
MEFLLLFLHVHISYPKKKKKTNDLHQQKHAENEQNEMKKKKISKSLFNVLGDEAKISKKIEATLFSIEM